MPQFYANVFSHNVVATDEMISGAVPKGHLSKADGAGNRKIKL